MYARVVRLAGIDFSEVLMSLYAGIQASRSIDNPAGAVLADLLEILGGSFSDIILAVTPAAVA